MEPKVVNSCLNRKGCWRYNRERVLAKQGGSGNNWAYGYTVHGPLCGGDVEDLTRKEVESCDNFGGFFFMQSLAGGTGSGFGTYVTERLRELYPKAFLVNHVVWPYSSGEVIVQHYNSVLSLAHLYTASDAVIYSENDVVESICTKMLGAPRSSFHSLNEVIARDLATCLSPTHWLFRPNQVTCGDYSVETTLGGVVRAWEDLIVATCPSPRYRLLTMKSIPQVPEASVPFSRHRWGGLLRGLSQMALTGGKVEVDLGWRASASHLDSRDRSFLNRCVSNLLFLRGGELAEAVQLLRGSGQTESVTPQASQDTTTAGSPAKNMQEGTCGDSVESRLAVMHPKLYPPWSVAPFAVCGSGRALGKLDHSATLLTNSQEVTVPLSRSLSNAVEMYTSGAYVHQYEQYGVSREDFVESFAFLETVLQDYNSI